MTKYFCECGSCIINTKYSITRHNKTKKHQKYIQDNTSIASIITMATVVELEPVLELCSFIEPIPAMEMVELEDKHCIMEEYEDTIDDKKEEFIVIPFTDYEIANISQTIQERNLNIVYVELRNYFNQYDFTIPTYDKDLSYYDNRKNICDYMNSIIDKLLNIESYLIECFPYLSKWDLMEDYFARFVMDRIVDHFAIRHWSWHIMYPDRERGYEPTIGTDCYKEFMTNHRHTITRDMFEHYKSLFLLRLYINKHRKMNQSVQQFNYDTNISYYQPLYRINCCDKEYVGKNVCNHLRSKTHEKNMLRKLKTNQYTKEDPILINSKAIPFYREKNYYVFRGPRSIQRFTTLTEAYNAGIYQLGEYIEYLETSIYCLNEKMETKRYAEPALTKHILKYMIQ